MKSVLSISVFEGIGHLLNTREAAVQLTNLIRDNPCEVIELDFTDIEFMSRSFADQYIKEELQLKAKFNVSIDIINANVEIIKILNVVSNTQHKTNREFSPIPIYKFSNPKLLSDYLFAI